MTSTARAADMVDGPALRLMRGGARLRSSVPLILLDVILAGAAFSSVLVLRFEGQVPADYWASFLRFLPVALVVVLGSNLLCGLYGQMWRHASIVEARRVLVAGGMSLVGLSSLFLVGDRVIPITVVVLGAMGASALVGILRFQSRLFGFRRRSRGDAATRVLVVGAGSAGSALLRDLQHAGGAPVRAVGLLDDDPRKRGFAMSGVRVLGSVDDLPAIAARTEADQVILAVPSGGSDLVRRVVELADGAGLAVKVLPSVAELLGDGVSMRDVRDLSITDLLGRQQVDTDLDAVRGLIEGKRVLITGAGGSIGSELARQIGACGPAQLVLLDNDETHLYDVATTVGYPCVQALVDIRDHDLLWAAFYRHRPEVVFHAAAHKHVPILEEHPGEAIRTNSLGTRNMTRVCNETGVERLVLISTDKAVNPSSVMGASKRLAEQIMLTERPEGATYCAVRFGNVLGSRGSVIPTFMRQIAEGGPVTITDARMTRFFMSIPEAVQLVLQAATFSEGGEIFMLDMGEPVRIVDLAERMIRLSGREVGTDVELRVVGMRPGEKLHEELSTPEEASAPTSHPSVVALRPVTLPVPVLTEGIDRLCSLVRMRQDDLTKQALFELVTRREDIHLDTAAERTDEDWVAAWNHSIT